MDQDPKGDSSVFWGYVSLGGFWTVALRCSDGQAKQLRFDPKELIGRGNYGAPRGLTRSLPEVLNGFASC